MVKMSTPYLFLLVADSPNDYGLQVLREVLLALGSLQVVSEDELTDFLPEQSWDVAIVDAGAVTSVSETVSQIRELDPSIKVVVITASKHWKIARAVYQAGAEEYLSKSLNREEMLISFRAILE